MMPHADGKKHSNSFGRAQHDLVTAARTSSEKPPSIVGRGSGEASAQTILKSLQAIAKDSLPRTLRVHFTMQLGRGFPDSMDLFADEAVVAPQVYNIALLLVGVFFDGHHQA